MPLDQRRPAGTRSPFVPQPVGELVVAQVVVGNADRRQAPLGPGAPSPWPSILVLWAIAAVIWTAILLHL